MYPVATHYRGQRVVVHGRGVGTVSNILGNSTWANVVVVFDEGERAAFHRDEVHPLIPHNHDGYFDGPMGYIDAG
ncbi:hypothetical protein Wildcat_156 [Mycobacterium phage Wildcat]|uniref:Uncharacterized protein n=3 Tax=Mycobacterium virus Wildcat TaxID=1993859 RepID=Q19XS8_9CAUD|nr:hypothetical protein Wildcat_156 [Mycobacterium phage Wildcat]ABE67736.1 hypothetical protein Wildcat_156 [Mycobacterium phage Wildcat]AQT25798.1 hypothetical protein EniyanLRS_149 [Mycobacterium phage EniyanLRS]QGJ90015.1 hypothetical protein PBI_MARYV_142 [Mycobacterium phage MaryV]